MLQKAKKTAEKTTKYLKKIVFSKEIQYNGRKEVKYMTWMWFALFVVLALLELVTINLISIWFSLGALIACLSSLISDNHIVQLSVFVAVSFLSLLVTRPFVRKVRNKQVIPTNLDRSIGKTGLVTKKITPLEGGEVKVDGKHWTALAEEIIEVGKKVEILAIEGVKLKVKPKALKEEK